jgi:putative oxidoreductase
MFPSGWPGRGLLLLRLLAGSLLIHDGVFALIGVPQWEGIILQSMAVATGMLLLLGLWTPIAGVLVVIVELWIAHATGDTLRNCIVLASLGAALAMLGPGIG